MKLTLLYITLAVCCFTQLLVTPVASGLPDGLLNNPGTGRLLRIPLSALTDVVGAVTSVAACLVSGLQVTIQQILNLATGQITCPGGSGLGGLVVQLGCKVNGLLLHLVNGVILLVNKFSLCILDANTGLVTAVFQLVGGILQLNPCLTGVDSGVFLNMTARGKEIKALYINGVQVPNICLPNAADSTKVDTVPLPTMTKTIAVQLKDYSVPVGFLASSSDGKILTNSLWKCISSMSPDSNWMTNEFDDSPWIAAEDLGKNNGGIQEINAEAHWVWIVPYTGIFNGDVYCRLHLN